MSAVELACSLNGHTDRVWSLAWSPDGSTLASSSGDKTIRLWVQEGDRWVCQAVLEDTQQRTIRSVTWSPSGKSLASASFDGTTCIWERVRGEWVSQATLEGHENEVKAAAWSASGALIATCSRDKTVWIWEAEEDSDYECVSVLHGHTQDVKMVKWHPFDEVLASASYDDTIKIWTEDDDDWGCAETLSGHTSTVWALDFDKTGNRLVSGSDDKTVIIWQRSSPTEQRWKNVCTLSGYHTRTIFSVSWSRVHDLIATGCADNGIRIFKEDVRRRPEEGVHFDLAVHKESAHNSDVNCVCWHPTDGALLASAADDNTVKIWRLIDA
eukprot:GILK01003988.1.p1 GENE.GILK01003988.1~~GILK01003988.1.p1  ORF type:complete len:339 (+),score=47.11 GILK01003988.1:40-1017(+)